MGNVPVHLRATVAALRLVSHLSTPVLAIRFKVKTTAMLHRMRELEGLELVECLGARRGKRALRWKISTKGREALDGRD